MDSWSMIAPKGILLSGEFYYELRDWIEYYLTQGVSK